MRKIYFAHSVITNKCEQSHHININIASHITHHTSYITHHTYTTP